MTGLGKVFVELFFETFPAHHGFVGGDPAGAAILTVLIRAGRGEQHEVEVSAGVSVMEAAVRNGVRAIDGDCGGAAACATCHVYVDTDWFAATGPQTAMEESMLAFAEHVSPTSRLGCQIKISPELDGLTVQLPESQH